MTKLDNLDKLFIVWAFMLQILLIVHFAICKPLFESYTMKFRWIIYLLCIPAAVISIVLMRGRESWSFWHLPYDIGEGASTSWILKNRLLWTPLFGIIMIWLYNHTNGSLLAPALFHPAMNTFGNNFLITPLGNILFIGLAIYAVVSDRMWKKLPADHSAIFQEPVQVASNKKQVLK